MLARTVAALAFLGVAGGAAPDAQAQVPRLPCDLARDALQRMDAQPRVAAHRIDANGRVGPAPTWVRAQGRWWTIDATGDAPMGATATAALPLARLRARLGRDELNCLVLAENNDLGPRATVLALGAKGAATLPLVLHVEQGSGLPLRYTEADGGRVVLGEQYRYGPAVDDPGVDRVTSTCSGGVTGGGGTTEVFRDGQVVLRTWVVARPSAPGDERRTSNPALAKRVFAVVDRDHWTPGRFGAPANMTCSISVRLNGRVSEHITRGQSTSEHAALAELQKALARAGDTTGR